MNTWLANPPTATHADQPWHAGLMREVQKQTIPASGCGAAARGRPAPWGGGSWHQRSRPQPCMLGQGQCTSSLNTRSQHSG